MGGAGSSPLLSQEQYYAAPSQYYAQGWIWMEFLVNSEYGQRSKRGEDFLKRYVQYTREGWQARVEEVLQGKPLHISSIVAVREQALTKALKRFDLKAAEAAFER